MKATLITGLLAALLSTTATGSPTKRSCSPNGALVCNGPDQFGLCNFGSVTFQSVAAGTECVDGTIVASSTAASDASSTSCSPNGALVCDGTEKFGLCNFGKVTFQSVAAGTKCVDGSIVAA